MIFKKTGFAIFRKRQYKNIMEMFLARFITERFLEGIQSF